MRLNAGCGCDIWGDIRVDKERYSKRYRKKTSANVIGDAHCLPFQNKVFSETKAFHVLEHLENPRLAFFELKRVTKGILTVRVPIWHFYSYVGESLRLIFNFFFFPIHRNVAKLKHSFMQMKRWKERYSDHKWYIRSKIAMINFIGFFPKEYELKIRLNHDGRLME